MLWDWITRTIIILFSVIVIIVGFIYYAFELNERLLTKSHNINGQNTIKVVEKGSAFLFGSSTVRVKYSGGHLDRSLSNDGKTLSEENASITWLDNDTAVVSLSGEEQLIENIEITFSPKGTKVTVPKEDESSKKDKNISTRKGPILEPYSVLNEESPDGNNQIEIREMAPIPNNDPGFYSIRVYYGKSGAVKLSKYEEYIVNRYELTTVPEYRVNWDNGTQVSVYIMQNTMNNHKIELGIYDTIKVNLEK